MINSMTFMCNTLSLNMIQNVYFIINNACNVLSVFKQVNKFICKFINKKHSFDYAINECDEFMIIDIK